MHASVARPSAHTAIATRDGIPRVPPPQELKDLVEGSGLSWLPRMDSHNAVYRAPVSLHGLKEVSMPDWVPDPALGEYEEQYWFYVSFMEENDRNNVWFTWVQLATSCKRFTAARALKDGELLYVSYRILADGTEELYDASSTPPVDFMVMGEYRLSPWYWSPIPAELVTQVVDSTVYVCQFCLTFMGSRFQHDRHRKRCRWWHPPGLEIYRHYYPDDPTRKTGLAMFQVDGETHRWFCANLGRFTRSFLLHKSDANFEGFFFYVLTRFGETGYSILGYFSKYKVHDPRELNLSCILAFPQYQGMGVGRILMEFSYELSKMDRVLGGPERPMSDMGLVSYRSFWKGQICEFMYRLLLYRRDRHRLGEVESYEKWMGDGRPELRGRLGEFGGRARGCRYRLWKGVVPRGRKWWWTGLILTLTRIRSGCS